MNDDSSKFQSLSPEDQRRVKRGVKYTHASDDLLEKRVAGAPFSGNLTEFSLIFEWKWDSDDEKFLYEKSTDEKFSGWVHIQDQRLDEDTYPGKEQKIKFEDGSVDSVASLSEDA